MGNSNQLCDESIINAQHWQLKCCFMGSISQEFSIQTEESFHCCCWAACGRTSRQAWIFKHSWVLMYIPVGSYLSHRSCHSLHLLLALGISCFQGRFWARAAAVLWWAAFPPVPPRWCCNRGSFPPSHWPGSTHRFIVRSCKNKEAIGSWNGRIDCIYYYFLPQKTKLLRLFSFVVYSFHLLVETCVCLHVFSSKLSDSHIWLTAGLHSHAYLPLLLCKVLVFLFLSLWDHETGGV